MTHIDWDDKYATGIEVIDFQHRKIISMINDLHNAMSVRNRTSIADTLRKVRDYAQEQFSFEEELLQAANYEYTTVHAKLHERFLLRLDMMNHRHGQGEVISHESPEYLTNWLTHHFRNEDQDYVPDVMRIMEEICT